MDFAPETLTGDVRDFLLGHLRQMPKPWAQMSEAEQRDIINAASSAASNLVNGAVAVVTSHEFPQLRVNVGKFTVKDGEAKVELLTLSTEKNLLALNGAKQAVLVVADPAVFFGETKPAEPEPDQRGLALGEEYTAEDGEGFDDEPDDDENDDITEPSAEDRILRDSGDIPDMPESLKRTA